MRVLNLHSAMGGVYDIVESEVVVESASNGSEGLGPGTGVTCSG